jgi:plasmid stabilization system protein ParE
VIRLSRQAERQVAALLRHFTRLGRPEAKQNLIAAIDDAVARIERNPAAGLPAPRPYPRLARRGRVWIKVRSYRVADSTTDRPVIIAVFYATADIPGCA